MEFDLNHAVSEVERNNACVNGGGECEGGSCGYGCSRAAISSPPSSNAASGSPSPCSESAPPSIYVELWHACAGPLTSLPKKGNVVVYFPQGHVEQAASASPFPPMDMPTFDLHPQIFCRVIDVRLLVSALLSFCPVF